MVSCVIEPIVSIQTGIVIIYGSSIDTIAHSHQAIQVIWPKSNSFCTINNNKILTPVIIDSKVQHQLQMKEGWILLVEPKSNLGETLSNILAKQAYKTFALPFSSAYIPNTSKKNLNTLLEPLFTCLNLPNTLLLNNNSSVVDKRIQKIISTLDECLDGDCIKPATWRASEVANQLALSESRFLHLFSQELGIAWRPYLLWRRIICAVKAIINGRSATDAAHIAGFSDSAHLSRTFKNTFGMTIRQASVLFKR